ncbi:50S ribosomal protein L11 methyltransferase [Aquihabitans sp. G128]|uniref:50S ribosomal protein L11 methyltransferase n=1 Tax=Aquihabitans sp. G128 TaxID=2849779 RepID=UPI001C22849F|nr:50S ribosomal protein L11 methyltransferase [Aquihabitans sp. G128]QXC63318.1 50S ribosomal protein L11 methyltransferase [Aquihabitans sp. G128]
MDDAVPWTRVVVALHADQAELVADRLWAFGPAAIEEQATAEGTVLLAGFAEASVAAAAAVAVDALTGAVPGGPGSARAVPVDDDGLDGWRAWARVEPAPPFLVVPTWLAAPAPAPGVHLLHIDPGRTFGSGSHPTTRLVLGRLGALVAAGTTVLDVGCGSGVLAVGAALLGADPVEAIDVDEGSPAATAANADRNGVADRVHASTEELATVAASGRRYDVVAANLLAPVVVALADDLVRVVAEDGALVVSGLLEDRWAEATDRLVGLEVVDVAAAEGWVAVTLRRRAPSRR